MPLEKQQTDCLTPGEATAALRNLSAADLARAYNLASVCAVGLVGWGSKDLLHEAMTKLMAGERTWPRGLHPLVVLKTAMSGIGSNIRKKDANGPIDLNKSVTTTDEGREENAAAFAIAVDPNTPEDSLIAKRRLEAVAQLVADDEELGMFVMALADGMGSDEAKDFMGIDKKGYEAAKKRFARKLTSLVKAGK